MEVVLADLLLQSREALDKGIVLASRLTREQFNWSPAPGAWSVAQCLMHLNVSNEAMLANMAHPMRKARSLGWHAQTPFELGWLAKKFIAGLEPPVKAKFPAPRRLKPPPAIDIEPCMKQWKDTHENLMRIIQSADGFDLGRIRMVSPLSPLIRYKLGTAFYVVTAHDRRHLWQAERVLAHREFPGAAIRAEA